MHQLETYSGSNRELTMKSFLCILSVLIMTSIASGQQTLKVITYNLQGMKPGTDYQTRLHYIVQHLKELDPDIVGLQEINETVGSGGADNMAKDIADSLSAHFDAAYHCYYSITHLAWDQFYESVGIVSKHPVEQEGFHQLATGVFPRKVVWNHIDTPLGKLNFFNTHLSYLPEHEHIRILQVQQIQDFIGQQLSSYPGIGAVLTGDFNSTPGSAPILLLTDTAADTGWVDTYHRANPASSGFTVPANSPSSRIDFIFYKSTGNLVIDSSTIVMDQPYDGVHYPSDHLGVMTVLSRDETKVENQKTDNVPEKLELYQNYPNPLNPVTTISYYLPHPEVVSLKIYNVLGQEVDVLLDSYQLAGHHSVIWETSGRSPGIYLYRVVAGQFADVKKSIVLR